MATLRYPQKSTTSVATELFRISGRRVPDPLIRAYLHLKAACARANWDRGVLSTGNRNALLKAIKWIHEHEGLWPELFPIDRFQSGAGTTLNMNVNEAISRIARRKFQASLHPNDVVNRSQSTNDTYPTMLRVALLTLIPGLAAALEELRSSLERKAEEFADIPKAGRTHLQDAVPMKLGEQFGSYVRTLEKLEGRLVDARSCLLEMPLGGTAVGNGLAAPEGFRGAALKHLRRETGIDDLQSPRNPFEAQASALDFLTFAHALGSMAVELQRIASDLRLQASGPFTGIHELDFPKLVPGSSIMPGKTNPSGLELLHQVLIEALGVQTMSSWAASLGQFELNVMLPAIAPALVESTGSLTRALEFISERVIVPMTANVARVERHWRSTEQWATLLSPEWGYDRVAEWVRQSREAGEPFLEWVQKNQGIEITPPDQARHRSSSVRGRAQARARARKTKR
jgi:fumarate hydratase class II